MRSASLPQALASFSARRGADAGRNSLVAIQQPDHKKTADFCIDTSKRLALELRALATICFVLLTERPFPSLGHSNRKFLAAATK
jgi:hypothetical protein